MPDAVKDRLIRKFQEEIQALDRELKLELPKEIKRARELGDLRENAEYAAAKERQRLAEGTGEKLVFQLVMPEDADATKGLISTTSPIGRAFLNREPGDSVRVVTPGGVREFEIDRLITIHDEASE
jgi:transcription elongation factor GreA